MQHFRKIAEDMRVSPLLAEIDEHPEVWDRHRDRLTWENSPHRETKDAWLRYADPEVIHAPDFFQRSHESIWYPAADLLPSLKPLVFDQMRQVNGERLGGVLMTYLPSGGTVYPHHDRGSWHSEYYGTKTWTVLRGNTYCFNKCEDETIVMKPGESWTFSNLLTHSVKNMGPSSRIVLITCMRAS